MPLLNWLCNRWFFLLKQINRVRGRSDLEAVYTAGYFERRNRRDSAAASHVAEYIVEQFAPSTVADLGCGTGTYLLELERRGIRGVGYEGSRHAVANAVVSPGRIMLQDLRQPIEAQRAFDVVICIEVAEHLPAKSADQLVDSIGSLGNTVVFSAASPGQGGRDHVNEQPPEYWIERFEQLGFRLQIRETALVRMRLANEAASWWLSRNLMVLKRVAEPSAARSHLPRLRSAVGAGAG